MVVEELQIKCTQKGYKEMEASETRSTVNKVGKMLRIDDWCRCGITGSN